MSSEEGNREPCGWSLGNWSGFRAGSGKTKKQKTLYVVGFVLPI